MLCPRCTFSPVFCVASLHLGVRYLGPGSADFGMEPECRQRSLGCSHPATHLSSFPNHECCQRYLSSAAAAMMTLGLRDAAGHDVGYCGDGCYGDGCHGQLRQLVGWCRIGHDWQQKCSVREAAPGSPSAPPTPGSPHCHGPRGSSRLPWWLCTPWLASQQQAPVNPWQQVGPLWKDCVRQRVAVWRGQVMLEPGECWLEIETVG